MARRLAWYITEVPIFAKIIPFCHFHSWVKKTSFWSPVIKHSKANGFRQSKHGLLTSRVSVIYAILLIFLSSLNGSLQCPVQHIHSDAGVTWEEDPSTWIENLRSLGLRSPPGRMPQGLQCKCWRCVEELTRLRTCDECILHSPIGESSSVHY